jgi:radical SAM superfamily enzyme YgiQ (UPF0313 family)
VRAFASSFHAWKSLEEQEGVKVPHGLVYPLAIVEAIGRPHGLTMAAEEHTPQGPADFDAIFISVLDSRCMMSTATHFRAWGVPLRRQDRRGGPLVWAGGQGLHNPMPFYDIADIVVIGDAEDPLPELLRLWERHGNTPGFLAAASTVEGVLVPAHHDPREIAIRQAVASDIGITLRENVSVNHGGMRRVEIARGCPKACNFCSIGWRTPYRENTAEQIITTIRKSPKILHLQAGDAESHSGISEIRAALRERGAYDQGWTGTVQAVAGAILDNPDQTVSGKKRYAFGVESVTERVRRIVGKPWLTDERLIESTIEFLGRIEGDSKGRAAWHLIAGLPGETMRDCIQLMRVIQAIDRGRRGRTARNLSLHWQPFQPLPGTPMQWFGAGGGARKFSQMFRPLESQAWVPVRQLTGRTDEVALVCTVLSRSDRRGADLLDSLADGRVTPERAAQIAGVGWGPLDPSTPLPWNFIEHANKDKLRKGYDVMARRLAED